MLGSHLSVDALMELGRAEVSEFIKEVGVQKLDFGRSLALDFGCGLGRITQALCPQFDRVIGVDISEVMVEKAESLNRFGERCRYVVCLTPDLSDIGDGSVDLVYSVNAFCHVPDNLLALHLRELIRVLAPNGLMMIQVGRSVNLRARVKLRALVRPLMPRAVRAWRWRKLWGGSAPLASVPVLPGYGRNPRKVRELVEGAGGRVVHVHEPDRRAEPSYFIRRSGHIGSSDGLGRRD
jgi:SAM-dependent methyltransferase